MSLIIEKKYRTYKIEQYHSEWEVKALVNTDAWLCLAVFKSRDEAENWLKYIE